LAILISPLKSPVICCLLPLNDFANDFKNGKYSAVGSACRESLWHRFSHLLFHFDPFDKCSHSFDSPIAEKKEKHELVFVSVLKSMMRAKIVID